tara:strand:+ start:185 stop:418 length:234 start_codon:yes stop_codon:yes gene_type:complete
MNTNMKFEEFKKDDWMEWMTETEDGKRFMELCDEYEKTRTYKEEEGEYETWEEFLIKKIQRRILIEKVSELEREKNG